MGVCKIHVISSLHPPTAWGSALHNAHGAGILTSQEDTAYEH